MSDQTKRQPAAEAPRRGEAAWRAHKEAVASRNAQASKAAAGIRRAREDEKAADLRAAERLERAELVKRRP